MEEGADYRVFRTERVRRRHPRSHQERTFSVIHAPDWVNIIAVTPERELVFVRQYRHGIDDLTLEIPGGMVDKGEEPCFAAQRELREETGYTSETWVELGSVAPNPALQPNQCSTWLALDATLTHNTEWDAGEVMEVLKIPETRVAQLIAQGQINHALVVVAFYWYDQYTST